MYRDKKELTKTSHALLYVLAAKDIVFRSRLRRSLGLALYPEYRDYIARRHIDTLLYKLIRRGWIQEEYVETKRILKLTKEGQLEALFQKAKLEPGRVNWDGKWRMVVFDVPEQARAVRNRLRSLLKEFGFYSLQASVYVYPFALNVQAVKYLEETGLMRYIRCARIDAFDSDSDLRKHFRHVLPKNDGRQKKET